MLRCIMAARRDVLTSTRAPAFPKADARRFVRVAGWVMTAASLLTPFPGWPSFAISGGMLANDTAKNRVKTRVLGCRSRLGD